MKSDRQRYTRQILTQIEGAMLMLSKTYLKVTNTLNDSVTAY